MESTQDVPWMPPRTPWGETWRLAVCLGISALVWSQLIRAQWDDLRVLFWIDLAVGLASFPLVLLRRRWPFAIAILLNVLGAVSVSSTGPGLLATVSYAARRRISHIVVLGLVGLATAWCSTVIQPRSSQDPRWLDVSFAIVVTVAVLAIGMYLGSRRELVWSLRQRAEEAERQQELRVEQARAREREQIAREMHDVLAHRISLITMHAGALSFRDDLPPDQIARTAELIATTSHEALADLREVLGTLREREPVRPQPTLAELADLVHEATSSGMTVLLENSLPDVGVVPQRLGRTIYRMIQEALTNARRHAPGAPVQIGLTGSRDEGIRVSVSNGRARFRSAARGSGAGLGLVGMRERFELAGGHLDVDDGDRWFVIEGWLPWPTA